MNLAPAMLEAFRATLREGALHDVRERLAHTRLPRAD